MKIAAQIMFYLTILLCMYAGLYLKIGWALNIALFALWFMTITMLVFVAVGVYKDKDRLVEAIQSDGEKTFYFRRFFQFLCIMTLADAGYEYFTLATLMAIYMLLALAVYADREGKNE